MQINTAKTHPLAETKRTLEHTLSPRPTSEFKHNLSSEPKHALSLEPKHTLSLRPSSDTKHTLSL